MYNYVHIYRCLYKCYIFHATRVAMQEMGGLPLSIEGQVHSLIKEATNPRNLSVMYMGWAAYM